MNNEQMTIEHMGQEIELVIIDQDDDQSLSELETLIESGFMTQREVISNYKLKEQDENLY